MNLKASKSRRAGQPDLLMGDWVILKDRHPSWKFRSPFEPDFWVVEKVERTMITARWNGWHVPQNVSWFRRVVPPDGGADAWPQEGSKEDAVGEDVQAACLVEAWQHARPSTSYEQMGPPSAADCVQLTEAEVGSVAEAAGHRGARVVVQARRLARA
ncbi:hypothetical protein NDU88_009410 [Pleurodeles waltl]|uniref:Murine leukemia virus integrase C-terminal domain-containing protein n=1 Tax=Pleurodeles waltl TaxID=8319 RepID=A0AAV7RYC3_PLEWA|nr:hypothetical protein NDU88_009410 [Pleurodeles waltl]